MASPFRIFRKHQKVLIATLGILAMIAFVFLVPLMSLLGGGRGSGGPVNPVVVSWDGAQLRESDLQRMLRMRAVLNHFVQTAWQLGAMASGTEGGTPPDFGPVSERAVVQTALFAKAAEDQGFVVSDATINRYIQRVTNNSVTPARLREIIGKRSGSNMIVTMDTVFAGLRTELLAQALISNYLIAADSATPLELWLQWQRLNDRVTVEVAAVPAANFLSQVPNPTDAELQTFYETYKDVIKRPEIIAGTQLESAQPGFKIPPQVALAYVRADYEKFVEKIMPEVTDQEIATYYEQNKRNFVRTNLQEDLTDLLDGTTDNSATTDQPAKTDQPATNQPPTTTENATGQPAETPNAEPAKTEQPKAEEPTTEQPKAEGPTTEQPKAEEPKTEEPKTEEPKAEEPKAEEPKTEEPKTEEPKTEEPKTEEPKTGEPKTGEPKAEEPRAEQPKAEEPKTEQPKTEEPKAEEPKTEEPKAGAGQAAATWRLSPPPTPSLNIADLSGTQVASVKATALRNGGHGRLHERSRAGEGTGVARRARFRLVAEQKEPAAAAGPDAAGSSTPKAGDTTTQEPAATQPAAAEPAAAEPAATEPAATAEPAKEQPDSSTQPQPAGQPASPPASPAPVSGASTATGLPAAGGVTTPATDTGTATAPAATGPAAEPEYLPLEEVKDRIRRDIASQRAPEKMDAVLDHLRQKLRRYFDDLQIWIVENEDKGSDAAAPPRPKLPDAAAWAKENGLTFETTPLTSGYDLSKTELGQSVVTADGRPLVTEAFSVLEDYKPVLTADRLGNRYLAWRVKATTERVPKLEEIRQQVITAWKMRGARELARKEAERLAAMVRAAGKPMAEVLTKEKGYNVVRSDPFSWYTVGPVPGGRQMRIRLSQVYGVDGAGPDFMAAVFKLEDGETGVAMNHAQTKCYVIRLAGRQQSKGAMHEDFLRDYEILGRIVRQQNSMQMISSLLRDLQESLHVKGWELLDVPRHDQEAS